MLTLTCSNSFDSLCNCCSGDGFVLLLVGEVPSLNCNKITVKNARELLSSFLLVELTVLPSSTWPVVLHWMSVLAAALQPKIGGEADLALWMSISCDL